MSQQDAEKMPGHHRGKRRSSPARQGFFQFLGKVQQEMKLVHYPDWQQVRSTTLVVIVFVFLFAMYLRTLDWIFSPLEHWLFRSLTRWLKRGARGGSSFKRLVLRFLGGRGLFCVLHGLPEHRHSGNRMRAKAIHGHIPPRRGRLERLFVAAFIDNKRIVCLADLWGLGDCWPGPMPGPPGIPGWGPRCPPMDPPLSPGVIAPSAVVLPRIGHRLIHHAPAPLAQYDDQIRRLR